MFKHIPCRKKPKALQNAPGMRRAGICGVYPGEGRDCPANRTAQRMSICASRFGFLRALHLNIRVPFRVFDQPQTRGFSTTPQRPFFETLYKKEQAIKKLAEYTHNLS
jgi:hypothetical protein